MRIHIGHHFFGAGNLGDDLMLAGLLRGMEPAAARCTCATPSADSQRIRFPQVQWLPYDRGSRATAIEACDAWVGVGGTPFQLVVGTWFLDHLAEELALCRCYGKPMYFIGVGVNERAALEHPHAREALAYASHIWARDEQSAAWIAEACGDAAKVTASADLAHLWLCDRAWRHVQAGVAAYVLNFEDDRQVELGAVSELIAQVRGEQRWLVQESRELNGSELVIWANLPADIRAKVAVCGGDYANASTVDALIEPWGSPETLLTSRYHAAVIGAWAGSRVACIRRNDKLAAVAGQLGAALAPAATDAAELRAAMDTAAPIPRERLERLANLAAASCGELCRRIDGDRPSGSTASAMNALPPRPAAALASLDEMNSPLFRSFMGMMNAFAKAHGLREFTNWTKIWEYPWLWHHALSAVPWRGARLVDLGSEISAMPWFLATLGASVRLIEVDAQWTPRWIELRDRLQVDVQWDIVSSEKIPLPDGWADAVTSFSVIEHQPDKQAAIGEVARVLRPGGVFAVSFDICEPEMGMTFPEWNGRALTLAEFEAELWRHPAIGNPEPPRLDRSAMQPFLKWHRTTAPHHNYVAGAAVLRKP